MKTLVVVGHPRREDSFTQQFFKEGLAQFDHVTWMTVDEQQSVAEQRQLLMAHDRIILQFPLYWYSAPAELKRWIDTVFGDTFALAPRYVLQEKELGLVVTTATAATDFGAGRVEPFTMDELLRPFEALAHRVQMTYLPPLAVHQFAYMTPDEQQRLLVDYQQYVTAPTFQTLAGRGAWVQAQLAHKLAVLTGDDAIKAQALLTQLTDNRDALDDLQMNLRLMKDAGDDDE